MQNVTVMNMLDGQANLDKPIENHLFGYRALLLLEVSPKITKTTIVHHNTKCGAFDEALVACDNVGVLERLEQLQNTMELLLI